MKLFSIGAIGVLVLTVFVLGSQSAEAKRKMYISHMTYAQSNADTVGMEGVILITNPSNVSQNIVFQPGGGMKIITYSYNGFNNPAYVANVFPISSVKKFNILGMSAGLNKNLAPTAITISGVNPTVVTLLPNESIDIRLLVKTYAAGPFLGNFDFGGNGYATYFGASEFTGQVAVQGFFEIDDVTTPGFVTANGSILTPGNVAGGNSNFAKDFLINGGKPF